MNGSAEILTLQGEVARAIAGEIRVKLTPPEQSAGESPHGQPSVLRPYLRGAFEQPLQ
jgi:hypothetical protein